MTHAHHWRIPETATNGVFPSRCKKCRAKRDFPVDGGFNDFVLTVSAKRKVYSQRGKAAAAKARRVAKSA